MDGEIKISEFNELQFKMIRIHKLQDMINDLWVNPLSPNINYGTHNYNLIISNIEALYSEVYPKCKQEEKEKADKLFYEIEELIDNNPPFEKSNHPNSKKLELDNDNWKAIKKKIKTLNLYLRELLDLHGYSPDKEVEDWRGL